LIVLQSEITDNKEYVLVMGFSEKSIEQAKTVAWCDRAKAVPREKRTPWRVLNGKRFLQLLEKKTNPDIDEFFEMNFSRHASILPSDALLICAFRRSFVLSAGRSLARRVR